jgi:tetratricopeptide (TPR) repeat protein
MDVSSNEAMEGLGLLAFSRSDIDETDGLQQAESWFLRALKFSRTARVLTFLGATYKALDKKAEAIHFCEEAIQEDCKYEEALFNLATLEEGSVQTRAIELFERAIQIDPDYGAAHERLEGTLQKRNDFTEAEYHFQTLDWN